MFQEARPSPSVLCVLVAAWPWAKHPCHTQTHMHMCVLTGVALLPQILGQGDYPIRTRFFCVEESICVKLGF